MTRKRIGTGLLEAFSETCEVCAGRGLVIHHEPVEAKRKAEEEPRKSSGRRGRSRGKSNEAAKVPSPADVAAMSHHHHDEEPAAKEQDEEGDDALDQLAVIALDPSSDEAEEVDTEDLPERDGDSSVNFDASVLEPFDQDGVEPAPEPRTVVTSVRRTAVRRAAGPPVATLEASPEQEAEADVEAPESLELSPDGQVAATDDAAVAVPAEEAGPESVTDVEEAAESTVHVPIKKKGSRKR